MNREHVMLTDLTERSVPSRGGRTVTVAGDGMAGGGVVTATPQRTVSTVATGATRVSTAGTSPP